MVRNSFEGNIIFNRKDFSLSENDAGTKAIASLCNKISGYYEFEVKN